MTVPRSISCTECSFSTITEKKMSKHMLKYHPDVENGSVSKKKRKLSNDGEISVSSVKTEPLPDFAEAATDIECRQTQQESAAQSFENAASDVSTTVYTCPFCTSGKEFSSLSALSSHKKSEHKDVVLNCCFCDFSTSMMKKWHKHLRTAHSQLIDPLLHFLKVHMEQEGQGSTDVEH